VFFPIVGELFVESGVFFFGYVFLFSGPDGFNFVLFFEFGGYFLDLFLFFFGFVFFFFFDFHVIVFFFGVFFIFFGFFFIFVIGDFSFDGFFNLKLNGELDEFGVFFDQIFNSFFF